METRNNTVCVGRIRGIGIFIHYSWLFIAGLILLGFWGQIRATHATLDRPTLLLMATFGTVAFFSSVLIHELAHALVARRRGFEVNGITLYLFGGATEADASSRSAGDEFAVAIVGPLTSVALAGLFSIAAVVSGSGGEPLPDLLSYLALINLILALFNLAPGLPLDGGRVFRSIVWAATGDFDKATRWATAGGVAVGYMLVGAGLMMVFSGNYGGLWSIAIGWMISQSAKQNEYHERIRSEFRDLVSADIMSSPVVTIPAETSIADAVRDYFARQVQTSFPVIDGERICGLLSVAAVRAVPTSEIWRTTAGHVALRGEPPVIVDRRTPMSEVIAALEAVPDGTMRALVVEDGHLLGIISPSDIVRRHAIADLVEPALAETVHRSRP
ncbi:MAG: site-2 protease family protein [Acidimicrobiales bacterium]